MSGERREHPRIPASLAGKLETDSGRASIAVVLTAKVVRNKSLDPMVSSPSRFKVATVIDPSPTFDQPMAELSPASRRCRLV